MKDETENVKPKIGTPKKVKFPGKGKNTPKYIRTLLNLTISGHRLGDGNEKPKSPKKMATKKAINTDDQKTPKIDIVYLD